MTNKTIQIQVEWTDSEAWEFAQFLKRAGFSDYRALARSDAEANLMHSAAERIRMALADQGIAPR